MEQLTNQEALLNYLEEQIRITQSSVKSENDSIHYWKSGKHLEDNKFVTNGQVDFFISNGLTRISRLQYKLDWLNLQLSNLK